MLLGRGGDHLARLVGEHAADHRHARLDDAGLFAGDRRQRVAELLRVVEADAGDDRDQRLADVGRIEPAAQSHFQHGRVQPALGKPQQGQRRDDLKVGGPIRAPNRPARATRPWLRRPVAPQHQPRQFVGEGSSHRRWPAALRPDPDAASCTAPCDSPADCKHGRDHGGGGAFALGAGDVHDAQRSPADCPSRASNCRMRSSRKSRWPYGTANVRS